ncbi:MAG TPA: Hsp20/alpha crystallin family protein [Bryobacteraceae bacterium]|jgi:HSP20 family protein|nr:Hsp20/alpha crystallin family protein [Bryobacteraceae bacterium]
MAKPDTKTEEQQGSAIARAGGYPVGFLTPGDCSRMTPFSLIRRMTEEMDGVFGEFALSRGEAGKPTWSPEVKLEIADDAIVLEGERWMENQDNKGGLHLTGRQYGRFYRTLPLPENADAERARARFENGVLQITVPLRAERRNKSREIPIETPPASPAPADDSAKAA